MVKMVNWVTKMGLVDTRSKVNKFFADSKCPLCEPGNCLKVRGCKKCVHGAFQKPPQKEQPERIVCKSSLPLKVLT